MKKSEKKKAEENVVVFQGRKHYYKIRFLETVKGRKDAKEYTKRLAISTKSWTVVKKIPGVGFCVYLAKTMKRGGKI